MKSVLSRIPIVSTLVHRACWQVLVSTNLVAVWFLYYVTGGAPFGRETWKRAHRVAFILDWAMRQDRNRYRSHHETRDRVRNAFTFEIDSNPQEPTT